MLLDSLLFKEETTQRSRFTRKSPVVAAATFSPTLALHLNSGTPPYLDLLDSTVEILTSLSIFALQLNVRLVCLFRSVQCESCESVFNAL